LHTGRRQNVKLLVVDDNEEENKLVENLKDFVDLNLCALVKKVEGGCNNFVVMMISTV